MNHLMVDIETLGKENNAVILSVGGVVFDPTNKQFEVTDQIELNLDIDEQFSAGSTVSGSTLKWWAEQKQEVYNQAINSNNSLSLYVASVRFSSFCIRNSIEDRVWANGILFDITILEHFFKIAGYPVPWSYRGGRCLRTLKETVELVLGKENYPDLSYIYSEQVEHNALSDARIQAAVVHKLVQTLAKSTTQTASCLVSKEL